MESLVDKFRSMALLDVVTAFINPSATAIEKVALKKVLQEREMTELQTLLSEQKISTQVFDQVAEILRKSAPPAPKPEPEPEPTKKGKKAKPAPEPEPEPEAEPEPEPEPEAKPKKTSKKTEPKAEKPKVEKPKKEAKGGGVIVSILDIISKAKKPITIDEIHAELVKMFPDREPKSMRNTIVVQIGGKKRPSRMEREKGITFEISDKKGSQAFQVK